MDRADEEFLRNRISRSKFVPLKRHRVVVTMRYVGRIAKNSAIVLQKAEGLRQDSNVEVAQAAAQVIDMATQIRMQCMVAFAKLTAAQLSGIAGKSGASGRSAAAERGPAGHSYLISFPLLLIKSPVATRGFLSPIRGGNPAFLTLISSIPNCSFYLNTGTFGYN
jgi:hypothetical protein